MLWQAFQKIEPKLVRIYQWMSSPPEPNLCGDRSVEYSWVVANLPQGPGEALEFGCGNSWLALAAARRGFKTIAIDLTRVEWFYVYPNLRWVQTDIFDLEAPPGRFDLIINCSSIEHVGLGRYGDGLDANGDLEAMQRLGILLKPGGLMLLTLPVGKDTTFAPLHRVYGAQRLPELLNALAVEKREYWAKDERNRWALVDEAQALSRQPAQTIYNLGCFVLRRPLGWSNGG